MTYIECLHGKARGLQMSRKELRDHVRVSIVSPHEVATVRLRILTNGDFGGVTSPTQQTNDFNMLLASGPCSKTSERGVLASFCGG